MKEIIDYIKKNSLINFENNKDLNPDVLVLIKNDEELGLIFFYATDKEFESFKDRNAKALKKLKIRDLEDLKKYKNCFVFSDEMDTIRKYFDDLKNLILKIKPELTKSLDLDFVKNFQNFSSLKYDLFFEGDYSKDKTVFIPKKFKMNYENIKKELGV